MDTADNSLGDTSTSAVQLRKRPTFTYGKLRNEHRDIPSGAAPDSHPATGQDERSEDASADQITSSAKRASRRSLPISSDSDSDSPAASSHFQFDFRRQMKELDEEFDNGDVHISPPSPPKSSLASSLPAEIAGPSPQSDAAPIPRHMDYTPSEDPFSGSLTFPISSSLHPAASSFDNSPLVTRRVRGRPKQRVTSDSELDPPSNSSSVSPVRHSINTPHLHSPPTPPTSEFEISTIKKSGKAKGKAPVRDVQPLQFNSEDTSGSALPRSENKGKRRESSTRLKTKVQFLHLSCTCILVDDHGDRHQRKRTVARLI